MPIKLPRGFARRKSAGNLAEALEGEPSSFRVLNRAEAEEYHAASRNSRTTQGPTDRPKSTAFVPYGNNLSFDDSRYLTIRTTTSDSSSAAASSSARHSSRSTEHSCAEDTDQRGIRSHLQHSSFAQPASFDPPATVDERIQDPSKPSVNRHRFSITRVFGTPNGPAGNPASDAIEKRRGRSNSASSDDDSSYSDLAPPALYSRVDLAEGTHNSYPSSPRFNNFGASSKPSMAELSSFELPEQPRPIYHSESDTLLSAKKQFSFNPYNDRPLPLSSRLDRSPPPNRYSPQLAHRDSPRNSFHSHSSYASSPHNHEPAAEDSSPISRDDVETQLLMDAAYATQALERQLGFSVKPSTPDRSRGVTNESQSPTPAGRRERPISWTNRPNFVGGSSTGPTPLAEHEESEPLFENSPASTVLHNTRETPSPAPRGTRIMTPAEFEQAKKDAEANIDNDDGDSAKTGDSDLEEDEDEAERARTAARQRRRQQANLAIYRQQMKKVTGEQPSEPERLAHSRFSRSLPNLVSDSAGFEEEHNNKAGDDSDDEVPLGVLKAHGFPSKSRPPTIMGDRPTLSSRHSSAQFSAYPAPLGSTRNDPSAGGGGALPPFARNLPVDPYVGASLVNQGNRESLRLNSSSSPAGTPPGGLVGVIVGEERARALRRGSPNTDGVYGPVQPPMQQQMPGPMRNMAHQQQLSPNEQAQMEMNNSMAQMMQMQMQWMQQMMQLQALSQQTGIPVPSMPGMPQMLATPQDNFYDAQPFQPQPGQESPSTFAPGHQRSTSRMSSYAPGNPTPSAFSVKPATSFDGIRGTYAPSIAPSERSNIGQPSRYRPVTPSVPNSSRTSSLLQGTAPDGLQNSPESLNNPRARPPPRNPLCGYHGNGASTAETVSMGAKIRAVSKPKRGAGGNLGGLSDDEDDAGWAEMKRKREERKSKWKPRRKTGAESPSFEQENIALEGLYYNGPSDD